MRALLRCFCATRRTLRKAAGLTRRFDGADFRDGVEVWISWFHRVAVKSLCVVVACSMIIDVLQGDPPAADYLRLIGEAVI